MTADGSPLYDAVGGSVFFERLVETFYRGVESDPVLLRLYPDPHDLGPARRRLRLFLEQYWGGPTTYSDERGHPRLRMRHMGFPVGELERDRWLLHMLTAVDECTDDPQVRHELRDYFVRAAEHLRNDGGLRLTGGG